VTAILTLSADFSAFKTAIAAVRSEIARLGEIPFELRDDVSSLVEAGEEFFLVDTNRRSAGEAEELVVRAHPTDRFNALLSALRTADINALVVEHG
jgi:hypothetical protein